MRLLSFLPLFLLLTLSTTAADVRLRLGPDPRMRAERVAIFPDAPGRTRLGALTYLGGIALESPDPAFGGFSAMLVRGDRFTLLGDAGGVVRFRMGADLVPREVRFGDLVDGPDTGWLKYGRDVESAAIDPATGRIWIGYERVNQIWRYDPALVRGEARSAPPAMADWSGNSGPESMVRLSDGSFLVVAERYRRPGERAHAGLRFARDPAESPNRVQPFSVRMPAGYDPSDMAALPDGRLLVLGRAFSVRSGFTATLVLFDAPPRRPGAMLEGREIARFAAPSLHDNFEALAVTREGPDTILWIASDDNQLFFQRSLLLKFRLDAPQAKSPPSLPKTGSR